jgi:hypothetical protein
MRLLHRHVQSTDRPPVMTFSKLVEEAASGHSMSCVGQIQRMTQPISSY